MCHHIAPDSVSSYLSGLCQQLEPYFPDVCPTQHSPLVKQTLKGCRHLKGVATKRKHALAFSDLKLVSNDLKNSHSHDDLLFLCMLLTGFFALMRFGELSFPNDKKLRNWQKVTKRSFIVVSNEQYKFHLPLHKADPFFKGNHIIIRKTNTVISTLSQYSTHTCIAVTHTSHYHHPSG